MDNLNIQLEVIIPVYNCKRFLKEAVQSILCQNYRWIEVILVDDGSMDGSDILCEELASIYDQVYVIHQKNGGVSSARNKGIEYVLLRKSDELSDCYIGFLDADDVWQSDFFSADILDLFDKSYDILGFTSARCNFDLTMRTEEVCVEEGTFSGGESCLKARQEHFASMFYAAKLIKDFNIRFMDGVEYGEDIIFRYECLYVCEKWHVKQKLLYLYRENEKSAVHNRMFGLDYYLPLLNAYLAMDLEMEQWADEKRGVCVAGKGIASFYVQDMINEHFMNFGSIQDLIEAEKRYPELFEKQNIARALSKKNILFKLLATNYVKGILMKLSRMIRRSYVVRMILKKRKYTIKI